MAQVGVLDENKYGQLLGKHRPRLIQSDAEFERLAAELEALDRQAEEGAECRRTRVAGSTRSFVCGVRRTDGGPSGGGLSARNAEVTDGSG